MPDDKTAPATPRTSFAALRQPGFRAFLATYFLAMMADNIEHVISYWMAYQKFHSAALGGFAVVSHWLPFLVFSVPAGALADRFDPRRLNQIGMLLFMTASLGWGYFFVTDTLQMWQAMVLLVIHGCAGVFWQTSSQILIHDIVTRDVLPSAVRLNATARTLGVLVGPAVGGAIMLTLGPKYGIFLNACFYLPVILWMWKAPYGPKFRKGAPAPQRAVRGWADIRQTLRDIADRPLLLSMILLAGAASFFIGNSYQAQMPNFAQDLGRGDPGVAYSALLAADAAGALTAGFLLERWNLLKPSPRSAVLLAMGWCLSLGGFAMVHIYPLALFLLFCAGICELSYNSMTQTIVQLNAPAEIRGRVIGVFNMCAMGMRTFSGITVGLVGTIAGVHWSLGLSALVMLCVLLLLRRRLTVTHA
ncbi:MFS transporter [Uliginosibacterium sp. H3]|uniref:MFS transporter n=1 Tax=Uliginosibacterium silvisoli TaxID=3114758 RepID=A0ABU6K241_9RHOO|nr:MFS transporter [Uliginosibacterium sp. H3]